MVAVVVLGLMAVLLSVVYVASWIEERPYREYKRKLFRRGRIKKVDEWER